MKHHAEKEIELFCEQQGEYGKECAKAALEAYEVLLKQGHSGYSIQLTKQILNRLIDGECLTPLNGTDDEWYENYDTDIELSKPYKEYQNRRYSALFKDVYKDGTVKYCDVNRACYVDQSTISWSSGLTSRICDELFPITMPYMPGGKYTFKARTFTYENGEEKDIPGQFNSIYIYNVTTPDGTVVELNRLYREDEDGKMVQIYE